MHAVGPACSLARMARMQVAAASTAAHGRGARSRALPVCGSCAAAQSPDAEFAAKAPAAAGSLVSPSRDSGARFAAADWRCCSAVSVALN